MKHIDLMQGEYIIKQTNQRNLILTNFRIRLYSELEFQSMMLEKISMIERIKDDNKFWLVLAILSFGASFYFERFGEALFFALLAAGALFLVFYFISKTTLISLVSDGGAKIDFIIKMKDKYVIAFIESIEIAKEAKRQNVSYGSLAGKKQTDKQKNKHRTNEILIEKNNEILKDKDLFE